MSEDNGAHPNLVGNKHPSPSQDAGAAANLVGCEGEEDEVEEDDFNNTLSGVQSTLPTPSEAGGFKLFLDEELVESVVQETNRNVHYHIR
ncbi:unnamed protein product [Coregonus sp. 'balchen']|nr:unnamed protein product [Coregonus sp. 'balchen']